MGRGEGEGEAEGEAGSRIYRPRGQPCQGLLVVVYRGRHILNNEYLKDLLGYTATYPQALLGNHYRSPTPLCFLGPH